MDRRSLVILGGAAAVVASVFAVRRMLADPCWRKRLGLEKGELPSAYCEDQIDATVEDSFPASDPPSYTATSGPARASVA